jgi:sulfite reductase (ferredoxin)
MTHNTSQQPFEEAAHYWKEALQSQISPDWAKQIDEFEADIHLKKEGKVSDQLFAETRLRKGAYGQRYDNGHRYDGTESKEIPFPDSELMKGPGTYWHAPGMLRIKVPFGGMNREQMRLMADLAEEYSDSIIHITTRQDIQLHFIHIDETPTIFRRLAAVGITTQEACGNSVRNVTACPKSGVCKDQSFDVTPYADAVFRYLLSHPDVQDFGRKFKISLSGCKSHPCGLSNMHDLGLIAKTKVVDGVEKRGFELYVGGGLGAVPYNAKLFGDFVEEQDLLPTIQGICRIYARYGEKQKRHMARIKYLVVKMGQEEFIQSVKDEIKTLPEDPRWIAFLDNLNDLDESPYLQHSEDANTAFYGVSKGEDEGFDQWLETNVEDQRQEGYSMVTINLPLGDMTPGQMRALADLGERFIGDTFRTTVEQNILLRWVRNEDMYTLYRELAKVHLAAAGAETLVDITSCPGTDTCKLGISSSRGLAATLMTHLAEKSVRADQAIKDLKIKVSGCFNSCGQQYLADIGFYGVSRIVNKYAVPHFQLLLGGEFTNNGGTYGLAIGNFPSKAVPMVVDKLTDMYMAAREGAESFQDYVKRVGKKEILAELKPLQAVPEYEDDNTYYTDWGDIREFSMKDKGIGECAGEVVTLTDFGLKTADREFFDAQVLVDEGAFQKAGELCFVAMKHAAQALIKTYNPDISEDPNEIMDEFKARFFDTKLIHDPFGGDRFVQYYFQAHSNQGETFTEETAQHRVEETRLFVEACHSCSIKIVQLEAEAEAAAKKKAKEEAAAKKKAEA